MVNRTFSKTENVTTMFLPETASAANKADADRKAAFKFIEAQCLELIPESLRNDVTISIQEVQCGDPTCSPIDTAIGVLFARYAVVAANLSSSLRVVVCFCCCCCCCCCLASIWSLYAGVVVMAFVSFCFVFKITNTHIYFLCLLRMVMII